MHGGTVDRPMRFVNKGFLLQEFHRQSSLVLSAPTRSYDGLTRLDHVPPLSCVWRLVVYTRVLA